MMRYLLCSDGRISIPADFDLQHPIDDSVDYYNALPFLSVSNPSIEKTAQDCLEQFK